MKHILIWLCLAAAVSFLVVFIYMTRPVMENAPEKKVVVPIRQEIRSDTAVYLKEQYSVCQEYSFKCGTEILLHGPARAELDLLRREEVAARYPESAGWTIIWQDQRVELIRKRNGLCPEHSKRWHLGLDKESGHVLVLLGPSVLGLNTEIVKDTKIASGNLPLDVRDKIAGGSFEFADWDELIATLDSMGE